MALIDDLEQFPSSPLAKQTRNLIDLALSMSGEYSDSNGITSHDMEGGADARPLHDGGSECWKFIRRARDKCWEKAGLDPAVFSCPEDANDIEFGDHTGLDVRDGGPSTDFQRSLPFDFLTEATAAGDWSMLAQLTSPDWGLLEGGDFDFGVTEL